jgi:hypothetical protein
VPASRFIKIDENQWFGGHAPELYRAENQVFSRFSGKQPKN